MFKLQMKINEQLTSAIHNTLDSCHIKSILCQGDHHFIFGRRVAAAYLATAMVALALQMSLGGQSDTWNKVPRVRDVAGSRRVVLPSEASFADARDVQIRRKDG